MQSGKIPDDYQLKTKLYITEPNGFEFMGIGVLWLLQHVESLGSIRKASAHMNLSYAKAHRMIKEAESHLGLKLIEAKRGGESREGASLTPTGRSFIKLYNEFQKDIKKKADDSFENFKEKLKTLYREES